MSSAPVPSQGAKAELRARLLIARRAISASDRAEARRAVAGHLEPVLAGARCVAGYLPLASEPMPPDLLDRLADGGVRVLVPVVTGAAPLDWCRHPGPVRTAALGITEPIGPRLGPAAIATADVILVPALAVDPLGHRLGRGGGHYDRTLEVLAQLTGPALPARIAVIYDGEFLASVPAGSLDQPMSAAVMPRAGVRRLPTGPGTYGEL